MIITLSCLEEFDRPEVGEFEVANGAQEKIPASSHQLEVLTATSIKRDHAVAVVAASIPGSYASRDRIMGLLSRLGRAEAAKHLAEKLPTSLSIKSRDLGEILYTSFAYETTEFTLGIKRLRWKDHRNISKRGEDMLAFSLGPRGQNLKVLKAEVKSRASLKTSVIPYKKNSILTVSFSSHPKLSSFRYKKLTQWR